MAQITVLDQNTINKIAAGEVIERPASVVKELLENAIDAKATAVTVEIRDGGTSFIRVTDNGFGIPKDEIALAFLRHSTSKIQSVEDLFTVSSLGFRGEALSSIAAVSQVEIITKTPESLTGTRYQIEGGTEKSLEEIGAPDGTTFIARNLFYNTPVRRKFLKTPQTEGAHVADLVEKIALSHPEVSVRFIQNNQNKLHTSGNHNLKDIIYTVYGREIAGNLLPVKAEESHISVHGFIGKPVIARSNRNFENYYINGRYIKSNIIAKAIEEAFRPFMMQHKYPFTMLHFTIDPEFLDVNVHPTKMELRFRDGEQIYGTVLHALQSALAHKELIPSVSLEEKEKRDAQEVKRLTSQTKASSYAPEPFEKNRMKQMHICVKEPSLNYGSFPQTAKPEAAQSKISHSAAPASSQAQPAVPQPAVLRPAASQSAVHETIVSQPVHQPVSQALPDQEHKQRPAEKDRKETEPKQMELFDKKLLNPESRIRHRLIGQLFNTYWMVEFDNHLYIIDQHAAHEKVLYEKTMASLKNREYTCQAVNPPIILTLSTGEEVLLKKHMEHFTGIGFEIEPFGGREYAVRGVPGNLFSIAKKDLLLEMLDQLSEDTALENSEMIYEKIASMSCKAAVKGNHQMNEAEANELIDQLLQLDNPYACPHGRPTIISMSKYELEKKFKRIV